MITAPLFLWLTVCFDGKACEDRQVFALDSFQGPAAVADCRAQRDAQVAQYMGQPGLPVWWLDCATVEQLEREGL